MIDIIAPVARKLLIRELSADKQILSFKNLQIFAFSGQEAPQTLQEIGRIRETEFRKVGAGRNLEVDLDQLDRGPFSYKHLVSWDPVNEEIVAAYRFMICSQLQGADSPGWQRLRTASLFDFSQRLEQEILPLAIELGRSVVNSLAKSAIVGLFSVWAGLGALLNEYHQVQYFFGTFTVYDTYPDSAKSLIVNFLEHYHHHNLAEGKSSSLLAAKLGLHYSSLQLNLLTGTNYDADFTRLLEQFKIWHLYVPPILLSYLGACRQMSYLGAAVDSDFAGALECAILVPSKYLSDKTKQRFVDTYTSANPDRFRRLLSE